MQKRVIIVHGWDGYPEEGWFPWLKNELEQEGFEVIVPQLPEPEIPQIESWVKALSVAVGKLDNQTYFVGHSIGCSTIARYINTLPTDTKLGGAVFVAGFFKRLTKLEGEEAKEIASPWLTTPLDFSKVKNTLGKSIAIFSDNDPYVPLDNQDDFREKLGSKIIIVHNMGHFSGSTGTIQLPIALESLHDIAR